MLVIVGIKYRYTNNCSFITPAVKRVRDLHVNKRRYQAIPFAGSAVSDDVRFSSNSRLSDKTTIAYNEEMYYIKLGGARFP